MDRRERIRRPRPERTAPIRGGAESLFGAPEPPRAAGGEEGQPHGGPAEAVARAVDLGYRVIDDYLRQGWNAARLRERRSYGPEALANDLQDLVARSMQYGAELIDLWMQMLGQLGVAQVGRPSPRPAGPGGVGAPAAPGGSRVVVAIESPRPAEVRVDLDVRPGRRLVAQELRAPGADPIDAVALEGLDPPRLRVRVPPEQPPGTYSGLVLDAETNLPVGTVELRLFPSSAPGDTRS